MIYSSIALYVAKYNYPISGSCITKIEQNIFRRLVHDEVTLRAIARWPAHSGHGRLSALHKSIAAAAAAAADATVLPP